MRIPYPPIVLLRYVSAPESNSVVFLLLHSYSLGDLQGSSRPPSHTLCVCVGIPRAVTIVFNPPASNAEFPPQGAPWVHSLALGNPADGSFRPLRLLHYATRISPTSPTPFSSRPNRSTASHSPSFATSTWRWVLRGRYSRTKPEAEPWDADASAAGLTHCEYTAAVRTNVEDAGRGRMLVITSCGTSEVSSRKYPPHSGTVRCRACPSETPEAVPRQGGSCTRQVLLILDGRDRRDGRDG